MDCQASQNACVSAKRRPGVRTREVPPVALRVREIRQHIERGVWAPEQATELAQAWGVSETTVRHDAAEASRQLEASPEVGRLLASVVADLRTALDLAFEQRNLLAIAQLCGVLLRVCGVGAHRGPTPPPGGRGWAR